MNDIIIDRPRYVEPILAHADTPMVKVLTGVRRCGKSTILQLVRERLREQHPGAQFVELNLESTAGFSVRDASALFDFVSRFDPGARTFFFFDEIQAVEGWERVVNALRVDWDCDIYLTGSNSRMLSGDLATHLAGRYVSFHVQPLAFAEFCALRGGDGYDESDLFEKYVEFGGFPSLKFYDFEPDQSGLYLKSVYESALLNDVIAYHQVRDVDLFHRVVQYALAHIGRSFSANSITKYLKSDRRRVSVDTVLNYLRFCVDAFLLHRAPQYDIPGKTRLRADEKYYVADHGLRLALGLSNQADIQLVLENIVYTELLSRGFEVYVGRVGAREVDFVARRGGDVQYVQVTYVLAEDSTVEREFGALEAVPDNHPKLVLSLDRFDRSRDGIAHRNLVQWLLDAPRPTGGNGR